MATPFLSLADMVKRFESGGNYAARNPNSSASGAYQYLDSTWRADAQQAGIDINAYPTAASAPPSVQDAVFNHTVSKTGLASWTCPGCDTPLSNYVQADPTVNSLPVFGQKDAPGTNTGNVDVAGAFSDRLKQLQAQQAALAAQSAAASNSMGFGLPSVANNSIVGSLNQAAQAFKGIS